VVIGAPICPGWSRYAAKEGDIIKDCGLEKSGHATILYGFDGKGRKLDFDHYRPFRKVLAADYHIHHAVQLVLTVNKPKPTVTLPMPSSGGKMGSKSESIRRAQAILAHLGYLKVEFNGFFGENTRQALLAFQRAHKVAPVAEIEGLRGREFGPKTVEGFRKALLV